MRICIKTQFDSCKLQVPSSCDSGYSLNQYWNNHYSLITSQLYTFKINSILFIQNKDVHWKIIFIKVARNRSPEGDFTKIILVWSDFIKLHLFFEIENAPKNDGKQLITVRWDAFCSRSAWFWASFLIFDSSVGFFSKLLQE